MVKCGVRTLVILTASLWCAGLSLAQVPPRDIHPSRGTASIRGRVVAADTGTPLRDNPIGLVAVPGNTTATTLTDADGRFHFGEISAGRYRLQVSPGPTSARYLAAEQVLDLADKQLLDRIEIKMARAGAISGRVHDEYGEPIAFAGIRMFRFEAGRQQPHATPPFLQSDDFRTVVLPR